MYSFHNNTPLPCQKVAITVSKNKAQLIDLICEDLANHSQEFQHHKLVITDSLPTPIELHKDISILRHDMKTTHEEADTILVQQVAFVQPPCAMVIADDTDIFVMLMHFCFHKKIKNVYMASPVHGRAVLDINASVKDHESILPNLLAAHSITGCDSVGTYHVIGKGAAHRVLKMKKYTCHLGDKDTSLIDVYQQCTSFMLACYKQYSCTSMTDARVKMWSSKVSQVQLMLLSFNHYPHN